MPTRKTKLFPEDQAKVDQFLKEGYNDVERKPFRPLMLLLGLMIVLGILSGISILIAYLNDAV